MPTELGLVPPTPPLHHFHTWRQQSCSYTSWKNISAVARDAAAILASTESNFPNHSAVYLSIIICRSTRLREGEILKIVLGKLHRVSDDFIWRLLYQEDKKKQKTRTFLREHYVLRDEIRHLYNNVLDAKGAVKTNS